MRAWRSVATKPARISRRRSCVRYEGEEFAKPRFLIAPQMPGFGEHAFDHALRFVPMSAKARAQKMLTCGCTSTVRRDDVSNHRGELVDFSHTASYQVTRYESCDVHGPKATA